MKHWYKYVMVMFSTVFKVLIFNWECGILLLAESVASTHSFLNFSGEAEEPDEEEFERSEPEQEE